MEDLVGKLRERYVDNRNGINFHEESHIRKSSPKGEPLAVSSFDYVSIGINTVEQAVMLGEIVAVFSDGLNGTFQETTLDPHARSRSPQTIRGFMLRGRCCLTASRI